MNIYIGSTFQVTGSLQQDGQPSDFTGWSVQFAIYNASGTTSIGTLIFQWLDQTQGSFTLLASSTSSWPAGKARIDSRLVTPNGEIILGPPMYLRILQSPLS